MRPTVRRVPDDSALASSVVAFLVAGVLFMGSVVAVLVVTRTSSDDRNLSDVPDAAAHTIQADSLANILLGSPGFTSDAYQQAYALSNPTSPTLADWSDCPPPPQACSFVGKTAAADSLTRLGLLDAQSPMRNMLDYAKFQNLRAAPLDANPADQLVNYEEARAVLGLDAAGVDFHVRAYPALQSVGELLACQAAALRPVCKDANLKVAYIGDIAPPAAPPPPPGIDVQLGNPAVTCSVASTPKAYLLSVTVKNGGTAPTQFRAVFDAVFSTGPGFSKSSKTPILAVNDVYTMSIEVPAFNGRTCGVGTKLNVDLYDSTTKLLHVTNTLTAGVSGATASSKDLWLESSTYNLAGSTTKVNYDGSEYDAKGKLTGIKSKPLYLEVRKGDSGDVVYTNSFTTSSSGQGAAITVTCATGGTVCPTTALPVGDYTARLYDANSASGTALVVKSKLVVVSAAPGAFAPSSGGTAGSTVYEPTGTTATEVTYLEALVQQFCPTYYDTKVDSPIPPAGFSGTWTSTSHWTEPNWQARCQATNPTFAFKGSSPPLGQPGDVFPDAKNMLRDGLVPRLICAETTHGAGCGSGTFHVADDEPRYDLTNVVVVGTNVDANEMAPAEIKYAMEDWVKGGGTLIVFGSADQSVNWLMPILKTGIKSSSGGVSVPDAAHPILHVPDELDYVDYDSHDQVWDFRGSHDADELFTQIVSQGGSTDFEPILAVSNPGAIQDTTTGTSGTVVLTTWQPYDLFACGTCENRVSEGLKFVNNVLMLGYGDLYLDYGPSIPQNTNVIPAVRFAQIHHPDFADPIQLKMNVFVFSSG